MCLRQNRIDPPELETDANGPYIHLCQRAIKVPAAVSKSKPSRVKGIQGHQHDIGDDDFPLSGKRDAVQIGEQGIARRPPAKNHCCMAFKHDRQGCAAASTLREPACHPVAQIGLCTVRPAKGEHAWLQALNQGIKMALDLLRQAGALNKRQRLPCGKRPLSQQAALLLNIRGIRGETGSHCDMVNRS